MPKIHEPVAEIPDMGVSFEQWSFRRLLRAAQALIELDLEVAEINKYWFMGTLTVRAPLHRFVL
jgi:hypothetical protein